MKKLTVIELIKLLLDENPDAIVAIENKNTINSITQLNSEGWLCGEFYMKKSCDVQTEYYCFDEISKENLSEYVKVLVICN